MAIDQLLLAAQVKERATELGFTRVGIASADASQYADYFQGWLASGKHGEMTYLAHRSAERLDPRVYFPPTRSVICVAINYYAPLEEGRENLYAGKIARYALGDDYHELMKPRLHCLADWLREQVPGSQTRCAVDTAPVGEKELAARAGIGWMGKNTCIIDEKIGSWLLLGEVLTDIDLAVDAPAVDRCGSCTRCIDACPTGAIEQPYQLNATQCISYQTIEAKTLEVGDTAGWLYGCDICQDVCPYNRRPEGTAESALQPRFGCGALDVREILEWSDQTYRGVLKGSAMKRAKLAVLKANAARLINEVQSRG